MADAEETQAREPQAEPKEEPQGTDWKAEARKWEKRAKENADKAKSWDEHEAKSKSELEKAQEAAKRAEAQVKQLKAEAERGKLRAKVSKETGVPADLIVGDDEESMTAFAKSVAAYAKPAAAPKAKKPGKFSSEGGGKDAAKRALARQMFGGEED